METELVAIAMFMQRGNMKYEINFNKDGYVSSLVYSDKEEGVYEIDISTIELDKLNYYKLIGNELKLDEEKYQEALAKEEFYDSQVSEAEVINEYRIIKESNYNLLITNIILLWVMFGLTMVAKAIRFFKSKQK